MTYKEKEQLLKFLFDKRNRILMKADEVREQDAIQSVDDQFVWCMQYALLSCPKECQIILIKEFILHENRDWWYNYYSRSTYYRLKQRAMDEFLHCLHQQKMIKFE